MIFQGNYEEAVRRLAGCGYEVLPDEQGYIVWCLTDPSDVSHCRNLDQLVDLADLFDWAERRGAEKSPPLKVP